MALTERFETYTKQARLNSLLRKAIREKDAALLELGRACFVIRHLWQGLPELAQTLEAAEQADALVKDCLRQLQALRGECPCPHCGAVLPMDAVFCSYCGKKVAEPEPAEKRPVRCPRCGEEAAPGHGFCTACGSSLLEETDTVRICATCGACVDATKDFCTACGASMHITPWDNICGACGGEVPPGSRHCPTCGMPLTALPDFGGNSDQTLYAGADGEEIVL